MNSSTTSDALSMENVLNLSTLTSSFAPGGNPSHDDSGSHIAVDTNLQTDNVDTTLDTTVLTQAQASTESTLGNNAFPDDVSYATVLRAGILIPAFIKQRGFYANTIWLESTHIELAKKPLREVSLLAAKNQST